MLIELDGKPLINRVFDICNETDFDTYVVTDSLEIAEIVPNFILTGEANNGTERCAMAAKELNYANYINVQGDMPDITPDMIEKVAKGLSKFDVTTLYTYMHLEDQNKPSSVKMIRAGDKALWFGRGMMGYGDWHLGIYGYKNHALSKYLHLDVPLEEKVEIAHRHLLPKQLAEHGLNSSHLKIQKRLLAFIIEGYTRESGVRGLEKKIAKMVRYAAMNLAMDQDYTVVVDRQVIESVLGAPKLERDKYENNQVAGVVTGLAWTRVGGDILFIESAISSGKGQLTMTGNLGTVMKESATIALEFIKSNAEILGINPEVFKTHNIHIHVPEGATPKDGPSAGVTMLTSLVSLYTQRKVKKNLAMTGEITLRGKVLPVGGIKEKILAAKRAKIKEIILAKGNEKDILEIPAHYLKGLTFHYVQDMMEVVALAVTPQRVKRPKKLWV